jgi:outer membrane protein assembly factor BamE
MRVKKAVIHRFRARAALAAGLACTLALTGCAAWRNQTQPAAPADTTPAAVVSDTEKSAEMANSGAQTTKVTKLQKFMWIFSPYRPDIQQGNLVSQEMIEQLKPGMTRDQVKFVLGTPLLQDVFHANRWDYPFYLARGNGELTTSRVTVFFKDDKLERWDGGNLPSEKDYIAKIAGTVPKEPPPADVERKPAAAGKGQ